MDSELLLVLGVSFFSLICIVIFALFNFSNRIDDKIGNRDTILSSKFDTIIDKLSDISKEISIIGERYRPIKTVDFHLESSGITGTISTRPEGFTSERLTYIILFSEPISEMRVTESIKKLFSRKLRLDGFGGNLILISIHSADLDENASLIKSFLKVLDNELSVDESREITESIEKKLREIL